jgi:hypothetical protein
MLDRNYSFAIEDLEDEGPSRRQTSECAPVRWPLPARILSSELARHVTSHRER